MWQYIWPFVTMGNQIFFQYNIYKISRALDFDLLNKGEEAQVLYKLVGFAYLVLNLGPYLVEFSQTVNELLVLKTFQDRNWERKSKFQKFCLKTLVSPIGPLMIGIKKFLRLVQGVSVLSVDLTGRVTEK